MRLSQTVIQSLLQAQTYQHEPDRPAMASKPLTVTISREVGALGTTLAHELGQRLGWEVYDQNLLDKVAKELQAPESELHQIDERVVSWLEEFLSCLLNKKHVSPFAYLKHLVATIRGLGEIGHCIIVGRGAHCVLPVETTLRIRLIADLSDRIRFMAASLNVSEKEAKAHIEKTEPERDGFVQQNFGRDGSDPHEYDMVLSTSRLSITDCAEAVRSLILQMGAREQRKEEHPEAVKS